jgi:hypothetical protein
MTPETNADRGIPKTDKIIQGAEAVIMRAKHGVLPGDRLFTTTDGKLVIVKDVVNGVNVIRPEEQVQIQFIARAEIAESLRSGYLSVLNDKGCREIIG